MLNKQNKRNMKTLLKSMFGAFALTMFVASTSFAQDAGAMQDDQASDTYTQDGMETQGTQDQLGQTSPQEGEENKTQIAQEDLPEEVSNALEEGEYANFTVAEAYEVNSQTGEKEYEIHFQTPDGQTEKETFSESGEVAR